MKRLTFEGNFCDIAMCNGEYRMTTACADGPCSQRQVWERLKMYEDREEQQKDLENKVSEMLYGYQLEDLARVATLIKKCDVKPEEIKRLSDNIVVLYGAIMKGVKKEVKVAADNVIFECRYPGYADVLRAIEDEKEGRK